MKLITTFLICSFFCVVLRAQPDSTRRDSAAFFWPQGSAQIMRAPILQGTSQGTTIVPRQQFCFDATIEIELFYGGRRSISTCLFLNSTDGYIGYTTPGPGGAINVLMPEIENFSFSIINFKMSNVYFYHNQKGNNNQLVHVVSTSNTDSHEYQMTNLLTSAPLARKSERRTYCEGSAEALAYKRSDEPTTWFLYGDRFPASIQAQKFFGAFGVGVVRTDQGNYIVMERTAGTSYTVIKRITKERVCFDPSGYKMSEADFYTKRAADLVAEREKINRDEAAAQDSRRCVAEKMDLINFRREQLRIQEENLRRSQSGNLLQNRTAQKGMLDMMDPIASVQMGILQAKIGICNAQEDAADNPGHAAADAEKINCLNQQITILQRAESEMHAADARYAANIAQALVEKSRIYMTALRTAGCN
ncbi:hypothetical protein [Ferruginibacter sp. SUN106]|uniref:hypothetical protein n=1 Tax=Ferruginibacter sp. SUN106 TaxID=2978348 RepID=UPI003D361778